MLALQLERRLLVSFPCEQRGFETRFVVASRAIGAGRARVELPFVHVLVAIAALRVSDGCTEVVGLVALRTGRLCMLAVQRKRSLLVVEIGTGQQRLPSARGVAGFARRLGIGRLKCAFVRVRVTALTASKR